MRIGNSGRGHRSHHAPMAEINIIPLVDVVLVLLIIFMATTAFIKESGLNMKLPGAKSTEVTPEDSKDVTVALTRDNRIFVDGKRSSEAAVRTLLTQRARKNKDARVIIKGDERIEYKRVVRIMDLAKQAGLPKVALGTQLPQSSAPAR